MIGNLGNPGRKFGLKFKTRQVVEDFQIDVLGQVFPVLRVADHFTNNLCYQWLRVFYDSGKSRGVTIQYPVDQVFVCIAIAGAGFDHWSFDG